MPPNHAPLPRGSGGVPRGEPRTTNRRLGEPRALGGRDPGPGEPHALRARDPAPAEPRTPRTRDPAPAEPRTPRTRDPAPGEPRTLRAVRIGPGARRALRAGARGTVELAFGPGGYLRLGGQHVLLAPARSPLGPLSLLVAGLARGDLVPGDPTEVAADGSLAVGALLRIDLASAGVGVGVGAGAGAPTVCVPAFAPQSQQRAALATALDAIPAAPPELTAGLASLSAGDLEAGVAQLAGRGDGLTPAGDDALAGFAAWRWAAGEPVAFAAERCAPLGRAYLRCAERGELPQPAAAVLAAIRAGDERSAARRARGLAAWGASSGAALLWGLAAGAAQALPQGTERSIPGGRASARSSAGAR